MNRIFYVDTFTDKPFGGNPTAVCLVDKGFSSVRMAALATELNLPVTAFIADVGGSSVMPIRYFTGTMEIPACGHATLAAAFILLQQSDSTDTRFVTSAGTTIHATRVDEIIWLSYPIFAMQPCQPEPRLLQTLGITEYKSAGLCDELETLFIELHDPAVLRGVRPQFSAMLSATNRIKEVVITSVSDDRNFDFLLRSFCPWIGIDEDPVTGSVHSVLAGFWKQRTGKGQLKAYQASTRGGTVFVRSEADRVALGGRSVMILEGTLNDF